MALAIQLLTSWALCYMYSQAQPSLTFVHTAHEQNTMHALRMRKKLCMEARKRRWKYGSADGSMEASMEVWKCRWKYIWKCVRKGRMGWPFSATVYYKLYVQRER